MIDRTISPCSTHRRLVVAMGIFLDGTRPHPEHALRSYKLCSSVVVATLLRRSLLHFRFFGRAWSNQLSATVRCDRQRVRLWLPIGRRTPAVARRFVVRSRRPGRRWDISHWRMVRPQATGYPQSTSTAVPSPGGQVSGMAGCGIPSTSPRGYHTTSRGQSCTTSAGGCVEGCPRAAARSGVARSTGCHTRPSVVGRSKPGARGSGAPVTSRDALARTPSSEGTRRYGPSVPGTLRPP